MKQVIKFARRTFGSILLGALAARGQSRPKRLTEEDEWTDAYELSKRARSDHPKDGIVPNADTAKRIAEAVASGLYSQETATHERPFRARLRGNVWTVMGTLPPLALGGVAIIQISKDDGRILFAHHTQ
jgi:hypothetical protein